MRPLLVLVVSSFTFGAAPAVWACGMPHAESEDLGLAMTLIDQLMLEDGSESSEGLGPSLEMALSGSLVEALMVAEEVAPLQGFPEAATPVQGIDLQLPPAAPLEGEVVAPPALSALTEDTLS